MENEDVNKEILQRVVRLETRMVQLGDHVGANLRTKQRITVHPGSPAWVEVDALDVSLSRILDEMARAGVEPGRVTLAHRGLPVASLYYKMESAYEPQH